MIVATAGHVDHGKTSLVRALTGVDTDRLEEERRRGMSIDLGFAYADLGGEQPTGFVDVPGHERFVRNMLAGVAAIDFALLVVAADDGPMPQTLEHLAILQLLGIGRGAVALTKIDRVSPQRREAALAEVRAALAPTRLRDAPVFPVATPAGDGVDTLREHLRRAERETAVRAQAGRFRLAVDRSFSLSGAGLVVTGAVFAGRAAVGDTLVLSPQGVPVRVRGIHAQNRPSQIAVAGQRCSLNLAGTGLRKADVGRGDWIVAPGAHAPTARLDVRVEVLREERRPLADGALVRLHAGAGAFGARVAVLGAREIAPGESGFAQLVLERPTALLHGDRFVLRDQGALRTIAGGVVVDPFGAARGRGRPARIAELEALARPVPREALEALLAGAPDGVRIDRFECARNLSDDAAQALRASLALRTVETGAGTLALSAAQWSMLGARLCEALDAFHARSPDSLGPSEAGLFAAIGLRGPSPVAREALRTLVADGELVRDGLSLRRPAHRPQLAQADAALLARVSVVLGAAGLRPPIVGELAKTLSLDQAALVEGLGRLATLGHLVRVAPNRWFLPQTVLALIDVARELARASPDGSFDAAAYRDRSGIGRNLTIQVLEFLDRCGATRFARDRRWIKDPAPPVAGADAAVSTGPAPSSRPPP